METLKDTFLHSLQRGIRVVMGTSEEAVTSFFSMKSEELGSGISSFSLKSEELGSGISSSSMKSEELGSWCSSPTSTSLPDADAALETLDREFQNLVLNDTENAEAEPTPKDSKSGQRSHHNNPWRPGEPDCAFFLRTGTCRYGSNCIFNHPPRRKNKVGKDKKKEKEKEKGEERSGKLQCKVGNGKEMENEMDKEKEKARLGKIECKDNEMENEKEQKDKARSGKLECKYYQKSGGCKFGKACRYYHPREKAAEGELELNFLGLPIRPGEKECPFYMREGSCKFATNCRFHHPDPTAAGGCDPLIPLHVSTASQPPAPLWPSQRPSIEPTSYIDASPPSIPTLTLPPQVVHPNPEWNGYQAPLVSPLLPTDVWQRSASITVKADDSNHQQKTTVDDFPERPGQPDCQYFVKNGDCKFRSACRFHHPRTSASKSSTCLLSPMGLPLRPDQTICTHYSRHGICRFGRSCKFDHPINVSSAVPAPVGHPSLDSLVMSTTESGWQ